MIKKNTSKITFVTRHYPPNPNINGESVWDMVKYLKLHFGIESNIICFDGTSDWGGQIRQPIGHVISLRTAYQGNNKLLKFINSFFDGYRLLRKALQFKDTTIVITTSPPLLPFWASLFFKKNINWGVWEFDLFPEAFTLQGVMGERNPFYKWLKKITYRNSPSFLIALGPQQAAHLSRVYQKDIPALILPCGVFFYQENSTKIPDWWVENKIFLGYCGNIGPAHNEELIKKAIDHISPDKHRLVLALFGTKAKALKAYAKDKPGVILVDSVPRNQLHFIDVHLVSLRDEWTHIAVPSKAVSAVCSGSSFIFCGNEDSDNWVLMKEAGFFINENELLDSQIKSLLDSITQQDIYEKRKAAKSIYKQLKNHILESYDALAKMNKAEMVSPKTK